jgi:hypothetical protein
VVTVVTELRRALSVPTKRVFAVSSGGHCAALLLPSAKSDRAHAVPAKVGSTFRQSTFVAEAGVP